MRAFGCNGLKRLGSRRCRGVMSFNRRQARRRRSGPGRIAKRGRRSGFRGIERLKELGEFPRLRGQGRRGGNVGKDGRGRGAWSRQLGEDAGELAWLLRLGSNQGRRLSGCGVEWRLDGSLRWICLRNARARCCCIRSAGFWSAGLHDEGRLSGRWLLASSRRLRYGEDLRHAAACAGLLGLELR